MGGKTQIDILFEELQALLPTCDSHYIRNKLKSVQRGLDALNQENRISLPADDVALVQKAQALMARNIQTPLTIAQIAEACGTSPTKLKKAFRIVLDDTVFRWYRALRIERSKRLLVETNLSIARIAALSGYANPSKFSKAFLQQVGASPRDWRAQARKDASFQ